jgi:hypothetical protein
MSSGAPSTTAHALAQSPAPARHRHHRHQHQRPGTPHRCTAATGREDRGAGMPTTAIQIAMSSRTRKLGGTSASIIIWTHR